MYGTFVHCSAFTEAANRSYINVLNVNSLWSTDSWKIVVGCLPNIQHTSACCLPRLSNTSTLNDHFVFICPIRVLFAFKCKAGLMGNDGPHLNALSVPSLYTIQHIHQKFFFWWYPVISKSNVWTTTHQAPSIQGSIYSVFTKIIPNFKKFLVSCYALPQTKNKSCPPNFQKLLPKFSHIYLLKILQKYYSF